MGTVIAGIRYPDPVRRKLPRATIRNLGVQVETGKTRTAFSIIDPRMPHPY